MLEKKLIELGRNASIKPLDRHALGDLVKELARINKAPDFAVKSYMPELVNLLRECPDDRDISDAILKIMGLEHASSQVIAESHWNPEEQKYDDVLRPVIREFGWKSRSVGNEFKYDKISGLPISVVHKDAGIQFNLLPPGAEIDGERLPGCYLSTYPITSADRQRINGIKAAIVSGDNCWSESYYEAKACCEKLNGRLPYAKELELAAVGNFGCEQSKVIDLYRQQLVQYADYVPYIIGDVDNPYLYCPREEREYFDGRGKVSISTLGFNALWLGPEICADQAIVGYGNLRLCAGRGRAQSLIVENVQAHLLKPKYNYLLDNHARVEYQLLDKKLLPIDEECKARAFNHWFRIAIPLGSIPKNWLEPKQVGRAYLGKCTVDIKDR